MQQASKPKGERVAVISLTTAKIDLRKKDDVDVQSEKQQNTMEPDEQAAQLLGSRKRLHNIMNSPESARSQPGHDN